MPDEALDLSAVGGPKINGLIGWEIIKSLYWEIDFQNRRVRVRAPLLDGAVRNMCCDFYPMVRMTVNGDETIVAAFDTGGNVTNFGKCMIGRFPGAEETKYQLAGAGQSEASEHSGFVVAELPVGIGGAQVTLANAFVHAGREFSPARTLVLSGSLGSDAATGRTLVIDYQNRHMSIK